MEKIISRKELDKHEELATRVFKISDKVYKILKIYLDEDYRTEINNLYKCVEYLQQDKNFDELVKPQDIFKCQEYNSIRFGIIMEYLQFYLSLEDIILTKNTIEKKEYFYRIAKILKKIKKSSIVYDDIHGRNILINPFTNEIKFIDPDSVKIEGLYYDYKSSIITEKLRFSELVLQSLYNKSLTHNYNKGFHLSDKLFSLKLSKSLYEYIKMIENREDAEGYITDFSDDFELDIIRFNKKILDRRENY